MNCWELKECSERTYQACPAYPHRGADCWKVTGTKCEKGTIEKTTSLEKIGHCRACNYYSQFANKY